MHSLLLLFLLPLVTSFTLLPPPTPTTALSARIAVFGASGLLASECIYQSLAAGDTVVGLTRNPANCVIPTGSGGVKAGKPLANPNLTLIAGSASDPGDVAKVFATGPVDGVIVALGGKTKDVGPTMLADSTKVVLEAMEKNGVKVSGRGGGGRAHCRLRQLNSVFWTGR